MNWRQKSSHFFQDQDLCVDNDGGMQSTEFAGVPLGQVMRAVRPGISLGDCVLSPQTCLSEPPLYICVEIAPASYSHYREWSNKTVHGSENTTNSSDYSLKKLFFI